MTSLDTLSLEIPISLIQGLNEQYFEKEVVTDLHGKNPSTVIRHRKGSLPIGVSRLNMIEGRDLQVVMSAKTLGQDYLQGINRNTIEQAFSSLTPIIGIEPVQLIEANPRVFSCDSTNNLSLSDIGVRTHKQVVSALAASAKNDRFKVVSYTSRYNIGMEYRGTQQEKNRCIAYCKHLDLLKYQNKEFLKSLQSPAKLIQEAEKQIRVEVNHTAFRSIRERFGIPANNLSEILDSTKPVNHDYMMKVIRYAADQYSIFDDISRYINEGRGDIMTYFFEQGIRTCFRELNCDEAVIKQLLRAYMTEPTFNYHWYNAKKPLRKILHEEKLLMSAGNEIAAKEAVTVTRKVLDLLKAA
jgi:hypothetical protein